MKIPPSMERILEKHSGMILSESHRSIVEEFIDRKLSQLGLSSIEYANHLESNASELAEFINSSTISETYFFREELQFDFLREKFFPSLSNRQPRIFCAACSTGEEPLSVYAMSRKLGFNPDIYATDINTNSLGTFRKGIYKEKSFRDDGKKYHNMILDFGKKNDGFFTVEKEHISKIHIMPLNLTKTSCLPFEPFFFDMIIIRNVFIYFSRDTVTAILKNLWNVLKPGGIILLSVNEIASVDCPEYFAKENYGTIYYLRRLSSRIEELEKEPVVSRIEELKSYKASYSAASSGSAKEIHAVADNEKKNTREFEKACSDILKNIMGGNFARSEQLIKSYDFSVKEFEYKLFLEGCIAYMQTDLKEAEKAFFKSYTLNREFWPSLMLLAYTYKKSGNYDKARNTFSSSLKVLTDYVKSGKLCYNFIVDFDPEYIISLCRKNIQELEKTTEK